MTATEIIQFKEKIEKETLDKITEKITITDSYFYAELFVINEKPSVENPFNESIKVIVMINLFNSKDFNNEHMTTDKEIKYVKAKQIKSELVLNKSKLSSNEDIMIIVYEEIAKQIAADLFQSNAENIRRFSKSRTKTYI